MGYKKHIKRIVVGHGLYKQNRHERRAAWAKSMAAPKPEPDKTKALAKRKAHEKRVRAQKRHAAVC